jgi:hypothetical protein
MPKFICIVLLLAFSFSGSLLAQEKFEKERRIKKVNVPFQALSFMDALNVQNKVKWFKEEGLNQKSIEAKFKHNKAKYSVEFDTLGNLEDVEIVAKWNDLASNVRDSICLQLKSACSKYKIVKVQKQYLGDASKLIPMLKAGTYSPAVTLKYELVVKCHRQRKVDLFEYLFSDEGQLISISKIVFKNSSHLEY